MYQPVSVRSTRMDWWSRRLAAAPGLPTVPRHPGSTANFWAPQARRQRAAESLVGDIDVLPVRRVKPEAIDVAQGIDRLSGDRVTDGKRVADRFRAELESVEPQPIGARQERRPVHPHRIRAGGEGSEEHTSELQSLTNLVCRLLLEKINNLASYILVIV